MRYEEIKESLENYRKDYSKHKLIGRESQEIMKKDGIAFWKTKEFYEGFNIPRDVFHIAFRFSKFEDSWKIQTPTITQIKALTKELGLAFSEIFNNNPENKEPIRLTQTQLH